MESNSNNNSFFQQQQEQHIPIHVAKPLNNGSKSSSTKHKKSNGTSNLRTRNYSDTDSSYVPGKNIISNFFFFFKSMLFLYNIHIFANFICLCAT